MIPGSSLVPLTVCVFPHPVACNYIVRDAPGSSLIALTPYANTVALNPSNNPSNTGFAVFSNTSSCVESLENTRSKAYLAKTSSALPCTRLKQLGAPLILVPFPTGRRLSPRIHKRPRNIGVGFIEYQCPMINDVYPAGYQHSTQPSSATVRTNDLPP